MKYKRPNECFKCSSRRCFMRIVRTETPVFDEIACATHTTNLEDLADSTLGNPGHMRNHEWSSGTVRRGEA